MKRTIAYIDGFNLYFGMREKGWKKYYWLNLWKMCSSLLIHDQILVGVKYFTSRIQKPDDKRKRQSAYIKALQLTPRIDVFFGKYETLKIECQQCHFINDYSHEKMSDVQLSTQFLHDAASNKFDVAILVTGDRDIVPAMEMVKSDYLNKRIVVAFPPMRTCDDLRSVTHAYIHIVEKNLKDSLFPLTVQDMVGNSATCPTEWQ
jgi:uncharacterized LabA/DUF88 family protein